MRLFKRPGLYLVLMGWWILVFLGIDLARYPIHGFLLSYVPYFVALILFMVFAVFLTFLDFKFNWWERMRHWGRFLLLIGSYAITTIAILVIVITLDSWRLIQYFGGDAGGSFGLLFVPSILVYFICGAILSAVLTAKQVIKRKLG